jgi:lysozyme family protein
MYQAIIIACLIGGTTDQCITLETQRWHETERACKADALTMAQKVHIYMRGYKATRYNCRALPKGILSK